MTHPMPDLSAPLSEEELSQLDDALLNRFDEDEEPLTGDEGILDVTELDGLLTAVVSSPVTIMPSQWFPAVWGDFPPVFETDDEVQRVFTLMIRHMNGIAATLMNYPDEFDPLFYHHEVDGREFVIVDDWCEGYMRGIELALKGGAGLDAEARRASAATIPAPAAAARNTRSAASTVAAAEDKLIEHTQYGY